MILNLNIFDKFYKKTNFRIDLFFEDSRNFFQNDFVLLTDFFSGKSSKLNKSILLKLNELIDRSDEISTIFSLNKNLFSTVDFWELLDSFDEIKNKLKTTKKIPKFLRSTLLLNSTGNGFVFNYGLSNQTIESVSNNVLNDYDFDNDWLKIALDNDLFELDYSNNQDVVIKLKQNKFQNDLVTSMVDFTVGDRIYGLDFKKKITYINNDLEVLNYRETAKQSVDILSNLFFGDIPENPELGIMRSFFAGANLSELNFPSLVRQLKNNFKTDDLFTDLEVKKLYVEHDSANIDYEIGTKHDLLILKTFSL